jgi:hypothetical protein
MDREVFDPLTRLLAVGPSRRHTLGALLGGAVASVLPAATEAAARKRQRQRCRKLLRRCTPGKAPRCCKGSVCGTSQIAGSFCCTPKDRTCSFSLKRDECCPGFSCSQAAGECVPLE